MNTPDDEPSAEEGAELSDEELLAKFQEFRDRLVAAKEDRDELLQVTVEMAAYLQKRGERLKEVGFCTDEVLAKLNTAYDKLKESQKIVEKATEKYFQATADVADCEGELTEKVFKAIHLIHSKWDEMDYAAQEQFRDVIDSYMDSREEYLSRLPIETRQRLEEEYPKWW